MKQAEKKVLRELLRNESLASVDSKYREGTISQTVFDLYCSLWANSNYRYSHLLSNYKTSLLTHGWKRLAVNVINEAKGA